MVNLTLDKEAGLGLNRLLPHKYEFYLPDTDLNYDYESQIDLNEIEEEGADYTLYKSIKLQNKEMIAELHNLKTKTD